MPTTFVNKIKCLKWCPETELNRRHADFQSNAFPSESNTYAEEKCQTAPGKSMGYAESVKPNSGLNIHQKENPEAREGATGQGSFDQGTPHRYRSASKGATRFGSEARA